MSSSAAFSFDLLSPSLPSEQLCYVHCDCCDTILAVSVPCSSLFKTVTVRCGHCTNLLSVNMRALLLPAANQLHLSNPFFATQNTLMDGIRGSPPTPTLPPSYQMIEAPNLAANDVPMVPAAAKNADLQEKMLPTPNINRPPEKRQRVPSAYNRFIKDEIQRIKAGNPDITHREAFSAAAKNWAHFPHIHFGVTPDQALKKSSSRMQIEDDGLYAAAAKMAGTAPF